MRFDSIHHRKAVEMCVFARYNVYPDARESYFPSLTVTRNGHAYFGLDGILVKQAPAMGPEMTPSNDAESGSTDSLGSWTRDISSIARLVAEHGDSRDDRIWLPMSLYTDDENVEEPEYQKTVVFIIRPSIRSRNPFDDREL